MPSEVKGARVQVVQLVGSVAMVTAADVVAEVVVRATVLLGSACFVLCLSISQLTQI